MQDFDGIVIVHHSPGGEHEGMAIYFVAGDGGSFKPNSAGISPVDLANLLNISALSANESGIGTFVFQDSRTPGWNYVKMQSTTAPKLANYFGVPVWLYTEERGEEIQFQQKVCAPYKRLATR